MPSASLIRWSGPRANALNVVDAQADAAVNDPVPDPILIEENLRGYVLLLSAHFQGFCRDLHTECSQFIASRVGIRIRFLVQQLLTDKIALDRGNPTLENIKADLGRFGFVLDLSAAHPLNPRRLEDLADMNKWRNAAAHHGLPPTKGKPPRPIPLTLTEIQKWRQACSGLAQSLDTIMYNQLRNLIPGPMPWIP